jgi:hypothetical protein
MLYTARTVVLVRMWVIQLLFILNGRYIVYYTIEVSLTKLEITSNYLNES